MHLLADAGYDSEANHQYARDVYQIKTTILPKAGRPTGKLPKTKYRREMKTDFDDETCGRRWQVETVFSMIKRTFGDTIRARTYWSQNRERMLLAITHNLAVILLVKELFYRSGRTPFLLIFSFFGRPPGRSDDSRARNNGQSPFSIPVKIERSWKLKNTLPINPCQSVESAVSVSRRICARRSWTRSGRRCWCCW